jgi:hypothetical protein
MEGCENKRWGWEASDECCVKILPSSLVTAAPVNGIDRLQGAIAVKYLVFKDLSGR